jgi:hypothetical protein
MSLLKGTVLPGEDRRDKVRIQREIEWEGGAHILKTAE